MTHYDIFCPICGENSIARTKGEPTDVVDGYTYHEIDGIYYIHEKVEGEASE